MIEIPNNILSDHCPQCQNQMDACICTTIEKPKPKEPPIKPIIRLDTKSRRGKVVTMITNLPAREDYLKKLAKSLKSKTGSGGTFYIEANMGIIEIQGEHDEKIKALLEKP